MRRRGSYSGPPQPSIFFTFRRGVTDGSGSKSFRLVTLIGLTLACATANAALMVNVEGVRGSGKTTWTLSGSSTTGQDGGIIGTTRLGRNTGRVGGRILFSRGVNFLSLKG